MGSADQRALLVAYLREGDVGARDRLVEELMPLVRSLANRYAGRGEPTEDLVQVGAIGLVNAIDRFELEKGVELSTYAVPTIVGEIRRHFRDRTWAVHVPRRLKELSLTKVFSDPPMAGPWKAYEKALKLVDAADGFGQTTITIATASCS